MNSINNTDNKNNTHITNVCNNIKFKIINNKIIDDILHKLINRYSNDENIIISCLFKKTKILAYAMSKPNNYSCWYSKHAEVEVYNKYLLKYNKNKRLEFGKIDILTIRYSNVNNDIILKCSKPCQFCIKSLKKINNIQNCYYSDNNLIYKCKIKDLYNNISEFNFSSGDIRIYKNL